MSHDSTLFTPFQMGALHLPNRLAMAPMTRSRANNDGNVPTDSTVTYYEQRASAGLIITEGSQVSPQGVGYIYTPGIYSEEQVAGWKKVTDAVHAAGGRIFIQLWHVGAISHPFFHNGELPVAPSAVQPTGVKAFTGSGMEEIPTPRALETNEVKAVVEDFRKAAENAKKAGFDGAEVHGANGYLVDQFIQDGTNQRTDEYGGSVRNRARFLLEALDAVREVWPEEYPLTMRLGVDDLHPDGIRLEDSIEAIGWMKEHGLDLADVSIGFNTDDMVEPPLGDRGFMLERAARIKREVDIPVATSWNLGVPQNAAAAIASGAIDLAFLGRPALSNPHWPVWAARELGHEDPFGLVPADWAWWLRNFRGHDASIGLPAPSAPAPDLRAAG